MNRPPGSWYQVSVLLGYFLYLGPNGVEDAAAHFSDPNPAAYYMDGTDLRAESGKWEEGASVWRPSNGGAVVKARMSNMFFVVVAAGCRFSAAPGAQTDMCVQSKDDTDPTTRAKLEDDAKLLAKALAEQLNK